MKICKVRLFSLKNYCKKYLHNYHKISVMVLYNDYLVRVGFFVRSGGNALDYTEKEKKGLRKVERMNKFFDKVLMPAVGVLIILTLLSFIVGKLMDKLGGQGGDESSSVLTSESSTEVSEIFQLRASVLDCYNEHVDEFEAYGYNAAEGYSQDLAICKIVDDELVIYQFSDSELGDFTILIYTPSSESNSSYDSVSLTVYSDTLVNLAVHKGDNEYKVTFTSIDFSSYSNDDEEEYASMMQLVSIDELEAMYDIFETDIRNLAQNCGISM